VLVADIYHRAVVLPRIQKKNAIVKMEERVGCMDDRADEMGVGVDTMLSQRLNTGCMDERVGDTANQVGGALEEGTNGATSEGFMDHASTTNGIATNATSEVEMRPRPTPLEAEDPDEYSGNNNDDEEGNGENTLDTTKKRRNPFRVGLDKVMIAMSNYGADEGKSYVSDNKRLNGWGGGLEVKVNEEEDTMKDEPIKLHGATGILSKKSSTVGEDEVDPDRRRHEFDPAASYRMLMEGVDNMCTVVGSTSSGMSTSWLEAWIQAKKEFGDHFRAYWGGIWENEENNAFDKFFLICELPFTVLRKLTVPIPCDDYYCRGLVAASVSLSPLWISFYIYIFILKESNLMEVDGLGYVLFFTFIAIIAAMLLIRFAPATEIDMSLKVSVPIAFIGFIVAATWIDTIATQLVKLLTLLGVVCRIPGSIMGLTVLAWGNSMGDLSANMTMAKKGLANMAITACFAGPVFNILIGLGLGFWKLNASTGVEYTEVELTSSTTIGFGFLAVNCILVIISGLIVNKGYIPKGYGYVALVLYFAYVITCIVKQFYVPKQE